MTLNQGERFSRTRSAAFGPSKLDDVYVAAQGPDQNSKEELTSGWVPSVYEAKPALESEVQGWSFQPFGPATGIEAHNKGGIEAVPVIRGQMLSGENNIIVSAVGFCADDVEGCGTGPEAKTHSTEAAEALATVLQTARSYHEEGWLKALVVYTRNNGGWSMQLENGELTLQGQVLQQFADGQSGEADTTAPSAPTNFEATYESEENITTVSWNPSTDPPLPDGHAGSGVASYNYRYRLGAGTLTAWKSSETASFEIPDTTDGEHIHIEANAVNADSNTSDTTSVEVTSEVPLTAEEVGSTSLGEGTEEIGMEAEPESEEEGAFSRHALVDAHAGPDDFASPFDTGGRASFENLCGEATSPCGHFNRAAAAAYAEKWALKGETDAEARENRNREYDYFGGEGGDCTNFASQALKAGGMRFMRANGYNSTNGNDTTHSDDEEFDETEGSWWAYYLDTPFWGDALYSERTYSFSASFVRAHTLQEHLIGYELGRFVKTGEPVRPGDIIFYDVEGTSLEYKDIDHAQVVTRVSGKSIWVAQHSKQYERTLAAVVTKLEDEGKKLYTDWRYDIVEPIHTAADSGESND